MKNLTKEEIAKRIADVVMNERFLNKANLIEKIIPILKIWLKKADAVKKHKGKPATVHKLQWTLAKKDLETNYWKNILRNEIGEENMKSHYIQIDQELEENELLEYKLEIT